MLRLLASSAARHARPQQHVTGAPIPALAACSQPLQQGLHTSSSPSAGYNLFFKEEWPNHKGSGHFGDIAKTIAARYRQLSPEQKQAYKQRWEEVKNAPAPPKQPKEHKKGYSGWTLFTKERLNHAKAQLGEDEALDMKAMMKQMGAAWKALAAHEKESYKAKAATMPPPNKEQ